MSKESKQLIMSH